MHAIYLGSVSFVWKCICKTQQKIPIMISSTLILSDNLFVTFHFFLHILQCLILCEPFKLFALPLWLCTLGAVLARAEQEMETLVSCK